VKTVTAERLIGFDWGGSEGEIRKVLKYKQEWTALEMLTLLEISSEDLLSGVIKLGLVEDSILNEFACQYAEKLVRIRNEMRPQFLSCLGMKRRWMRGEVTELELADSRSAVMDAVVYDDFQSEQVAEIVVVASNINATVAALNTAKIFVWSITDFAIAHIFEDRSSSKDLARAHKFIREVVAKQQIYELVKMLG
jgi:hypothetical protein